MIYFDNAATTWPKPESVLSAMRDAVTKFGANPGRGGYQMAVAADEKLYECRKIAASFFGLEKAERLIFTPGCTFSINTVLKGVLSPGDHVIISNLEHNAVVRPLRKLEKSGVRVTRAVISEIDDEATVKSFRMAIRRDTRMIFVTGASNVFGVVPPIKKLSRLCADYGLLLGVDAAQSAGTQDCSADALGADFVCAPAHKGLYGIMGLGLLAICRDMAPEPITEGGTGSLSAKREQPEELPDRFESGTLNMAGVCALAEGIKTVQRTGVEVIERHEREIASVLWEGLGRINGVSLYSKRPDDGRHAPLVSFNIGDLDSEQAAARLARFGLCTRAGYHCAYDAHLAFGTEKRGAVRAAPSMFTSFREAEELLRAVHSVSLGRDNA